MITEQVITIVGLIGIGGLLKSGLDFIIASRKMKQDARHTLKETRYKAIILLCYVLVNFDKEKTALVVQRPDIGSIERLRNEIRAEFINMALYGSDEVINAMQEFIIKNNNNSLSKLAIAMRKDLFGIKTSLNVDVFVAKV